MLELLKNYIDNIKEPQGEMSQFIETLLKYTKDERLLGNFITSNREHPWDCKMQREDIVYLYLYYPDMLDDLFHDYSQCYWDLNCEYGAISIVLLLCLYCFFDKEDIIIGAMSGDNATVVDTIIREINIGVEEKSVDFYEGYIEYHKFIKKLYKLEHEYLTPEYCEIVDGEIDFNTYECTTFASILMIKLINENKKKQFVKVMKILGFYKIIGNIYAVDTFENIHLNSTQFDEKSINTISKLLNKNKPIREVYHFNDVINLYEIPEQTSCGALLIEDIMNENHSMDEILL